MAFPWTKKGAKPQSEAPKRKRTASLGRSVESVEQGDTLVLSRPVDSEEIVVDDSDVAGGHAYSRDRVIADQARSIVEEISTDEGRGRRGKAKAKSGRDAKGGQAEDAAERLSDKVVIEFYPGMAKEDAIEMAKHWASTNMDVPSLCFYYVMKARNGYAIEIQQGVGEAYLPSVIDLATRNPGHLVVVPMVRRKMTVFYSAALDEFDAQWLPELTEPPVHPDKPALNAVRGGKMSPVVKQHKEWLIVGASTFVLGALTLISSLTIYALDPAAKMPPNWRTTEVTKLPVLQWNKLQPDSMDSYVTRMEFVDGDYRIVRQSATAQSEIVGLDPNNPQAGMPGVPGAVPAAPGATVASGMNGVAPGMPGAPQGMSGPPPGRTQMPVIQMAPSASAPH